MTQKIDSLVIPEKAYLDVVTSLAIVREDLKEPSTANHVMHVLNALAAMSRLSTAVCDRCIETRDRETLRVALGNAPSSQ